MHTYIETMYVRIMSIIVIINAILLAIIIFFSFPTRFRTRKLLTREVQRIISRCEAKGLIAVIKQGLLLESG